MQFPVITFPLKKAFPISMGTYHVHVGAGRDTLYD
jgi:hypothetical protein